MTIEELRAAITDAKAKADAIVADVDTLDIEQQAEFDGHIEAINNYQATLDRKVVLGEIEAGLAEVPAPRVASTPSIVPAQPAAQASRLPEIREVSKYTGRKIKGFSDVSVSSADAAKSAYSAGRWIQAALFGNDASASWCRDNGIGIESAMTLQTNTGGGYLVPDVLSNSIINLRNARGVFRANTRVVPMASETMLIPRRSSGTTAYWVGENLSSSVTTSDAVLDQIQLTAKQLAGLTLVSEALASDSVIGLAAFIADELAYSFADAEDEAGFNGDGTSTYGGIFGVTAKINDGNHAGALTTTSAGEQAFSDLTLAHFEDCISKCGDFALPGAKWYISQVGFYNSMQRLVDAAGGNTNASLSGGEGFSRQFLGFPVVITQVLNSVTTDTASTIKCLFGDLAMATTLGNREGFTVRALNERYAELLQVGIRATQRLDIEAHDLGNATVGTSAMSAILTNAS